MEKYLIFSILSLIMFDHSASASDSCREWEKHSRSDAMVWSTLVVTKMMPLALYKNSDDFRLDIYSHPEISLRGAAQTLDEIFTRTYNLKRTYSRNDSLNMIADSLRRSDRVCEFASLVSTFYTLTN